MQTLLLQTEISNSSWVPRCNHEVTIGEENSVVWVVESLFSTLRSQQSVDIDLQEESMQRYCLSNSVAQMVSKNEAAHRRKQLVFLVHDENRTFERWSDSPRVVQEADIAHQPGIVAGKVLHGGGNVVELAGVLRVDIEVLESMVDAIRYCHLAAPRIPADRVSDIELSMLIWATGAPDIRARVLTIDRVDVHLIAAVTIGHIQIL